MRRRVFALLLGCLVAVAGCGKRPPTQPSADAPTTTSAPSQPKLEACALLKREEIAAVQGSPITDTKGSEQSAQGLRTSQCYYSAEQSNRSVSLALTQSLAEGSSKQALKDYWNRMFGEHDGGEEGERRVLQKKIESLGDEAYWVGTRVGGTLYVLKNGAFIRLSLGGPDNEQTKIDKTKKLAEKALGRL